MKTGSLLSLIACAILACGNLAETTGWKPAEFVVTMWRPPPATDENLMDEPQVTAFPAWAKLTAYLRAKDPVHLAYINFVPGMFKQHGAGL